MTDDNSHFILTKIVSLHHDILLTDATHAEGKQVRKDHTLFSNHSVSLQFSNLFTHYLAVCNQQKALVFEVGGNAVIEGINEMVKEMEVGQKVQAIIPPALAFGDKGICIENGECLVNPKSYLVYDIYLKRSAIPPP